MSQNVAWGLNTTKGVLGLGNGTTPILAPTAMAGSIDFVQAMAGHYVSGPFGIGLTASGAVYTWGANDFGQLGNGGTDASNHQTPVVVSGLSGVRSVYADSFGNGWALLPNGDLYGWGNNSVGNLGLGHGSNVTSPTLITTGVAKIRAGTGHSILLKTNGAVWTAGSNNAGQLGNGNTTLQNTWQVVTPGSGTVVDISGSDRSTYLVRADGSVLCCGFNGSGQLGFTADAVAHSTFLTHPITDVAAAYGVNATVFFMLNDGTSWSCGANGQGVLGTGSTTPSSTDTPLQMVWPGGVTPIQWGITGTSLANAGIALGSDHLVYTWGQNTNGQMGNGTTLPANNATPISSNGLTGINWVGGMGACFFAGDVVVPPSGRSFVTVIG